MKLKIDAVLFKRICGIFYFAIQRPSVQIRLKNLICKLDDTLLENIYTNINCLSWYKLNGKIYMWICKVEL